MSYDTLHKRLQELAYLNRGVRIIFHDERNNEGEEFCYERGIIEFVEYLNPTMLRAHWWPLVAIGPGGADPITTALRNSRMYHKTGMRTEMFFGKFQFRVVDTQALSSWKTEFSLQRRTMQSKRCHFSAWIRPSGQNALGNKGS